MPIVTDFDLVILGTNVAGASMLWSNENVKLSNKLEKKRSGMKA